jgi:uncharacterized membrane protein YtjA (UPF0391 family)
VSRFTSKQYNYKREEEEMLYWALVFFILAIIASLFGFTGIAVAFAGIAKFLFFVFVLFLLIFLVAGVIRGRPPTP